MADWEERFHDYVGRLGETLGHADRRGPLRAYTTGLLLPGERKSVEPMAARVDPARVGAARRTSGCTTSSPRPPGTTPPCGGPCATTRTRRCRSAARSGTGWWA